MKKLPDPKICLIGGTGRCGSSLLKKIFQQHPKAADTGLKEWRLLSDPDGLADFYSTFRENWHPQLWDIKVKRLERLLNDLGRNNFITGPLGNMFKRTGLWKKFPVKIIPRYAEINISKYCPVFKELCTDFINGLNTFKYEARWFGSEFLKKPEMYFCSPPPTNSSFLSYIIGEFYKQMANGALTRPDEEFFIDDNAYSILWFDKILQFLPEAKLVHIYRDPRDVVCSMIKQSWAPSDMFKAVKYYKGIMNAWFLVKEKIPAESYMEIKFESIVGKDDLPFGLPTIGKFWGMPPVEEVFKFKIDRDKMHIDQWLNLNKFQRRTINILLKDEIARLGYKVYRYP